jgi:6-phosphogluconolactonase
MGMRAFITAAFSLVALSTVSAESLPVYFGTYTGPENSSKGIYRSTLDLETGKLSDPVLAAKAKNPSFIEIHPNGKFLYAVSEDGGAGSVSAYAIDTDKGDLKFLNERPSGGAGPCHVSIDHAGKNLLVANYGSGSASVIPIKPDGRLGEGTATAQINFRISNETTISSGLRPPVIGYTGVWKDYVAEPLNSLFPSGPMSKTTQKFFWSQEITLYNTRGN